MMEKKEYLETVAEQIRFKQAKSIVSEELEGHIDDQKEAFVLSGMGEKEAYDRAVTEMGNPIDVGIAMDRIHRPKMEWKMILLVLAISIMGVILQWTIYADMGSENYPYNITKQIVYAGAGLLIMILFCFIDYTRIAWFAKTGASVLNILLLLSLTDIGLQINRQRGYIAFFGIVISLHLLTYLYIPFFGGILYHYKNRGTRGLIQSILWMLLPVFLSIRMPDISLAFALFVIMMIQICLVMRKGWFDQSGKSMALMVFILIGSPVFSMLYYLFFGAVYQRARILAIFPMSMINQNNNNYTVDTIRNLLLESNLFGKSVNGAGSILPNVASDYLVTYVCSYYGILAAVLLMIVLAVFVLKVFKISVCQKNQLGMVIGLGCSLVFAVQIMMYCCVNFTMMPSTKVFLPFFTYGGTGTVVSYALIGILLSIYRYQNVNPVNPVIAKAFRILRQTD